jgi:hypothetical protein
MKQCKSAMFSIFLLILTAYNINAQKNNTDSISISLRLERLENFQSNEKEAEPLRKEKLEKFVTDAINENNKDIEGSKKLLSFVLFIGLPITLLSLIGLYFGAIKKARKEVKDKIEGIVEKNRDELIRLIDSQEFDTKLRTNKRILVLGASDVANTDLKSIMEKMKFQNLRFRTVNNYTAFQDYDLIVFNNGDGTFPQQVITDYIIREGNDHIAFVAYTTKNLDRHDKLNFANSRFTLYHNILNTLKYSEVLKLTH